MKLKKGDKVTILFHLAGLTSEDEHTVLIAHKGNVITVDTDEDVRKCKKFSTKTGKCLNDDTTFGARRELKLPKTGKPKPLKSLDDSIEEVVE